MATIQETLWNRITAYIGGSGTAPTLSMYSAAGISGITTQTLAWVNASIPGMTLSGESAADKAALSAISASAAKLLNLANGSAPDMAANALDEFDFANLRITVCASDLALINSALGAQTNDQVHSKASVQALVDAAQDVQRVIAGVPAATLTASDFAAIGISGVSADNLRLAAVALAAHGGGKTTVAELQTIVTDANTPMVKFMSDVASTPPQAVGALNTSLALNGLAQAEQRFDLELPSMLVAADNEPDPEHKNSLASPLMALGRILWGDGSGYGNTGIAGLPYDGGGDDDELQGTEAADIIFGDGSGGGAMNGTSAGKAGSGNDRLSGGAGNDLLFGDGFAGAGELGGYGGGGGGDLTWYGDDGQGGIGAGVGMGRVTTNVSPSWLGRLNQNTRTQAQLLGVAEDNWVGGAGVRNGNINQGAQTDTVSHDLNDAAALRVSRYGGRSVYDKVLWDLSGGTSGFGVGNTKTDAAGIGSGGTQVDGRAYAQQRGTGNDVLRGGKGADWLMGGGGADMFVWTGDDMDGSSDYIVDFNAKEGDRSGWMPRCSKAGAAAETCRRGSGLRPA